MFQQIMLHISKPKLCLLCSQEKEEQEKARLAAEARKQKQAAHKPGRTGIGSGAVQRTASQNGGGVQGVIHKSKWAQRQANAAS